MIQNMLDRLRHRAEIPLPVITNEVPWEIYLSRLAEADRINVEEACRRLEIFHEESGLLLGVMAVGSVLNGALGAYHDVDLLFLPRRKSDIALAETAFEEFILSQPELMYEERDAATEQTPREREWKDWWCYDVCRYWDLQFPLGKLIQLFVCTGWHKMTLRQKIEMEATITAFYDRKFAYQLIL